MSISAGQRTVREVARGEVSQRNSAPTGARILGLDAWRGTLLTLGIILHAANFTPTPFFSVLKVVGSLASARMPAFFLISGYLAIMTLNRTSDRQAWFRNRLILLGVPLLFGLAVLNPLMFLATEQLGLIDPLLTSFPERSSFHWYAHLWFLIVLIILTLGLYATSRSTLAGTVARRTAGPYVRLRPFAFPLFVIAVATLTYLTRIPGQVPAWARWIVFTSVTLSPFYALGCALKMDDALMRAFTRPIWMLFGIPGVAYVVTQIGAKAMLMPAVVLPRELEILLVTIVRTGLCILVIHSALHVRRVPGLFTHLAQSSYAIYLLHVLTLVGATFLVRRLTHDPYAVYFTTVPLTLAALFLFDQKVVKRVPLLKLLLNGRVAGR